jgi:hypothetical protein
VLIPMTLRCRMRTMGPMIAYRRWLRQMQACPHLAAPWQPIRSQNHR